MASPADYAAKYRNLQVGFPSGPPVTVTIEKYLTENPDSEMGNLVQAVKEYVHAQLKQNPRFTLDLIVNGQPVNTDYDSVKLHIVAPFYGKGSPEDCQIVAQLAVLVNHTSKDHLARYCGKYLGLDCNGFVGNYLFHERDQNPWLLKAPDNVVGPSSSMEQFVAAGVPVKDVSTINPANLHLFIEVDNTLHVIPGGPKKKAGHIVISEPNKYTPTSFVVNSFGGLDLGFARKGAYGHPALWGVESTADLGLSESWYAIKKPIQAPNKPVNRGIYVVFRGNKQEDLNFELVALPPAKSAN